MTTPHIKEMVEKITKKYDVSYFDGSTYAVSEEFEKDLTVLYNHARNFGYNAGLADGTDKPLLAIEQMLQKAREERKGWKGYVAVDPKADNYKYSPVFSDRKGAELWVKGKEINGLEVVEVDILLVDHSELDQDKK